MIRDDRNVCGPQRNRRSHEVRQIRQSGRDICRVGIVGNNGIKHPRYRFHYTGSTIISAIDANEGTSVDAACLDDILSLFMRDREDVGERVATRPSY